MSTNRWLGSAPAVAQANTLTVGGTPANGQVYSVTMGLNNAKAVSYTATGPDTNPTIAAALQALLAASATAEFAEVTWTVNGAVVTGTASTPGTPFANASSATGTGTLVTATATADAGPNDWTGAADWGAGAVPVTGDTVYVQNSGADVLYGLAQSSVTLTALYVDSTFTATVGLPFQNANGYYEYRPTYLQIGATNVYVGGGAGGGTGSGRVKHDAGSTACTWTVYSTGQPSESGLPSLIVKGTNAANVLYALGGTIGVALFAGETATLATLDVGFTTNKAGDVTFTGGAGLTTTNLNQTGGSVTLFTAPTNATLYGGTTTVWAGNMTSVVIDGGTLVYNGGGTLSAVTVGAGGVLDLSQAQTPVTITACNLFAGATVLDPNKRVTWTNGLNLNQCGVEDVTLVVGKHVNVLPGVVH